MLLPEFPDEVRPLARVKPSSFQFRVFSVHLSGRRRGKPTREHGGTVNDERDVPLSVKTTAPGNEVAQFIRVGLEL